MIKLNVFTVASDVFFSIGELKGWAVERFRAMLQHDKTSIDEEIAPSVILALSDDQLLDILTLTGAATLLGGMTEKGALLYAMKAVKAGQGLTPFHKRMRYMSQIGQDDGLSSTTPDMTWEQFHDRMLADDPAMAEFEAAHPSVINKGRDMFYEHQRDLIEAFQECAAVMTSLERDGFDWHEIEIEEPPASEKKGLSDLQELLGDFIGELGQTRGRKRRGSRVQ